MALHDPPQDIFPKECVYTHDPTGLNVLKKGCASYCNQTILVSVGVSGHCAVARGLPSGAGQAAFLGQLCCTPEGFTRLRWGVGAAAAGQWGWQGRDAPLLCLLQKPGCCKGFFGPDCAQCPGGFSNPCYGKGNVSPPAPRGGV